MSNICLNSIQFQWFARMAFYGKLADDVSADLINMKKRRWFTHQQFGGCWKSYTCAIKLVKSSHNTHDTCIVIQDSCSPIVPNWAWSWNGAPSTQKLLTKRRQTVHHLKSATTKLFRGLLNQEQNTIIMKKVAKYVVTGVSIVVAGTYLVVI